MPAIYLTEPDVTSLFKMSDAFLVVEEAFKSIAVGTAFNMTRQRMRIRKGALHLLPAAVPYKNVIGYKAYTSFRTGLIFRTFLHSSETGELLAVIDSNELGRLRTGAASGVATKYLSKQGAKSMLIFGSGYQAQAQIEAILLARKLENIHIYSRDFAKAAAFAEHIKSIYKVNSSASKDIKTDIATADIITTITTSPKPLFTFDMIDPKSGVHINAAGSNALIRQELDERTVEAANILVVDNKEVSLVECGDILPSLEKGRLHMNEILELGDIVAGNRKSRQNDNELTIFLSQGMGLLDIISAEFIYKKAVDSGIGQPLPF